jgi:IS1 family transposase
MNKLTREKRAQILGMMVEGISIRSITRLTGASKNTVVKLLASAGQAALEYQNQKLRNLTCKKVQCDEIWSFVYAKQKNVPEAMQGRKDVGSVWTWTASDADTKLVPSFAVGPRDGDMAYAFMCDLADRLSNRIQLTTDGHAAYLNAVRDAFRNDIDYAMLIKIYGESGDKDGRYSPPACLGAKPEEIIGHPKAADISTSYVERQNLSMRMGIHRFARLTNAFSKKLENHVHSLAIYFLHCNFVRVHQTLRVTPAMAAGVVDRLWDMGDMLRVVEDWEAKQPHAKVGRKPKAVAE